MSGATIPVTVVVAFYSRSGVTERRALTAAVGAVNARALIRMRRMPDAEFSAGPAGGDGAELERMRKEYVPPTEADVLGAEALIVAVPSRVGVGSSQWAPLVKTLTGLANQGKLRGKVAAVVPGGDAADDAAFATFLLGVGFVVVPPAAVESAPTGHAPQGHAQAHGRRVAEVARALNASAGASSR